MTKKGLNTDNLHSDRADEPEHGVLHKPVHTSVAYGYDKAKHLAEVFQGKRQGYNYGRQLNPTVTALQKRITKMEAGLSSVGFSTGMAAISSTMLALLKTGDHVISSSFLFGNTNSFFETLKRLGIEVSFVDATQAKFVEEAVRENTKIVFTETIANPVTQVADLVGIGQVCKDKNLVYIVDNTMTSPFSFKPKNVGASLIINSLTKYIGGHGNALGGMVTDTGIHNWETFDNITREGSLFKGWRSHNLCPREGLLSEHLFTAGQFRPPPLNRVDFDHFRGRYSFYPSFFKVLIHLLKVALISPIIIF